MFNINFTHTGNITPDIKGYIIDTNLNVFCPWKKDAVMHFIL